MLAAFRPCSGLLSVVFRIVLIVPLVAACLAAVIGLSVAASRSRLHIHGYVGLAFTAFAAAMIAGHFSGAHNIAGTAAGIALAIMFFLLIAVAIGSVLALFFYRHPDL
jgi:hypothetical protein